MARLVQKAKASGHKILIVDDTEEVVESTRLLLEKDGHDIQTAMNGPDAISKIQSWQPHLVILDYFMPGMTGEEVVTNVRPFDREVQILLQTGYASEKPPRQMLHKLDIQGYHDKSEGPEKLLIWVDASLKSYRQIDTINKSRRGLRHILDAVPEMYNLQTLEDLLLGVLEQMEGLLGGHSSLVAAIPEALNRSQGADDEPLQSALAITVSDEETLEIVAGTGRFTEMETLERLDDDLLKELKEYLRREDVTEDGTKTFIPLRVGPKPLGIVYFDRKSDIEYDMELLRMFAMQASQALENRRLFGMATEDDLTKVFLKAFFFKRMESEVAEASRYEYPVSLAIIDVDKFKTINDSLGHLVGDAVLKEVSAILRSGVRGHDFIGRFGGDEFVVALPHTDSPTAVEVLDRLRHKVELLTIPGNEAAKVTLSCGVATLLNDDGKRFLVKRPVLPRVVERLLSAADEVLYQSKQKGRNSVSAAPTIRLSEIVDSLEVARS
ncbi:MAG: diguanylate cyclase [Armatimonadetes bacterium]|nr:diguanylate cyclase [Armatimonadota bacterium]